jgi:hypothetical protein
MSAKPIQLDLFINEKVQLQALEHEEFKKKTTNSIRGLFARYNEVEYILLELSKKLDRLVEEKVTVPREGGVVFSLYESTT